MEGVEGYLGLDDRGVFMLVRWRGAVAVSCCGKNVNRNIFWSIKMCYRVLFVMMINGPNSVKRRKEIVSTAQNQTRSTLSLYLERG